MGQIGATSQKNFFRYSGSVQRCCSNPRVHKQPNVTNVVYSGSPRSGLQSNFSDFDFEVLTRKFLISPRPKNFRDL